MEEAPGPAAPARAVSKMQSTAKGERFYPFGGHLILVAVSAAALIHEYSAVMILAAVSAAALFHEYLAVIIVVVIPLCTLFV